MKFINFVFSWAAGIVLVGFGVLSLFTSIIVGALIILSGLLLIPVVRALAYKVTGMELSRNHRAILVGGLVVAAGVQVGKVTKDQADARMAEQELVRQAEAKVLAEARIAELQNNRESIVMAARTALENGELEKAVMDTQRYEVAHDAELMHINAAAKSELKKIKDSALTEKLLSELKIIPSSDFKNNLTRYQKLFNLHPTNARYKEKVAYYESKQSKAIARGNKIAKQFDPWNGVHVGLEKVLKKAMNDPDSYEHVETKYGNKGENILVNLTYRGKNSFGGVVTNTASALVTIEGNILDWSPAL